MLTFNLKKEWFEKIKSGKKLTNTGNTNIIGLSELKIILNS